jgi:cell division protein FtsW (lipid II flippase)
VVRQEVVQLAIFCALMSAALLTHIIINIGSNLGVIPLMGQPLAFLSVANSHLLTFVIPTIVAFSILQKEQVRVMS